VSGGVAEHELKPLPCLYYLSPNPLSLKERGLSLHPKTVENPSTPLSFKERGAGGSGNYNSAGGSGNENAAERSGS
jgi:hypothetical protein